MLIYIYTYILKHNLFSLYVVNLIYILKTDHLALDNQLICSFLGKTTIKSFHFKWHHFSDISCFYEQILIRWNLQREVRGFITLTVWREVVSHGRDGITAEKSVWKFQGASWHRGSRGTKESRTVLNNFNVCPARLQLFRVSINFQHMNGSSIYMQEHRRKTFLIIITTIWLLPIEF